MSSTSKSLLFSLALSSFAALPASADLSISIDFFREQGVFPGSPFVFFASPFNTSPSIISVDISSQNNKFNGHWDASNRGSSSPADNFANIKSEVEGVWSMTINGVDTYSFSMSLGSIGESHLPAVTISSPVDGATGVSLTPTYQWNDPAPPVAFSSVSYELIKDFSGGFGYPPPNALTVGDTSLPSSLATPSSLDPNSLYAFNLIYSRDAKGGNDITVYDPTVPDPNNPGSSFTFTYSARLLDQASSTFTTVPEPGATAVFAGLGLAGFAGWRRFRVA